MNKKMLVLFLIVFIAFVGVMKIEAKAVDSMTILTEGSGLTGQGFGTAGQTCEEILKPNLAKLIKLGINVLRIAGAIIAIIKGMTLLIPPIMNGDAKAIQVAGRKCVKLGIILLIIGVFPTIIRFIGVIFKYDLSCIF